MEKNKNLKKIKEMKYSVKLENEYNDYLLKVYEGIIISENYMVFFNNKERRFKNEIQK